MNLWRRSLGLIVTLGLLAACSSTNQRSSVAASDESTTTLLLNGGDATGGATADTPSEGDAGLGGVAPPAAAPGAPDAPGNPGSTPGSTAPPSGFQGELRVGLARLQNYNSFVGSLSGKGLSAGDVEREQNAVIEYLNANGGIGRRKVVPVYADYDSSSSESFDSQMQRLCATWTEDNNVVAAMFAWAIEPTVLLECMARHNTPLIFNSVPSRCETCLDSAIYDRYSKFLYTPTAFEMTSAAKAIVQGLASQRYFGPGVKVGLVRWDLPSFDRATANGIKPALSAQGVALAGEAVIHWPNSNGEIADTASAVGSAILRFRTAGITHVMMLDSGGFGALATLFMQAAESQNYRPKYGLGSGSKPEALRQNAPLGQLQGAMGIGWNPGADVGTRDDVAPNATTSRCLSIMSKVGETFADRNALYTAIGICDAFFFLKSAIEAGGSVTPDGLRAGVESLGTSFEAATQIPTRFGPGRHAGIAGYRTLAFNAGCSCFKYGGGVQSVG